MKYINSPPAQIDHVQGVFGGYKKKPKRQRGCFIIQRQKVLRGEDCCQTVNDFNLFTVCSFLTCKYFTG